MYLKKSLSTYECVCLCKNKINKKETGRVRMGRMAERRSRGVDS